MYVKLNYDCFYDYHEKDEESENEIVKKFLQNQDSLHPMEFDFKNWIEFMKTDKNWFTKLLHPKKPQTIILYGFSLNIFIAIQSLITNC